VKLRKLLENKTVEQVRRFIIQSPNFKYLGAGCSRVAYLTQFKGWDPTVLKIPQSDPDGPHRAQVQTKNEIEAYENWAHLKILPKVYDWDDENFLWIEMEYLRPITDDHAFFKKSGLPPKFFHFPCKILKENKKKNIVARDIYEICYKHGRSINEYTRSNHWGLDPNGKLKVLDFGL
jgi:hypothetical protein